MSFLASSRRHARAAFLALALTCAGLAWAGAARAADSTGNYAVRGLGSSPCTQFIAAVDGNSPQLRSYIAWLEGAVSMGNRLSPGVFDTVPFSASGALAAVVMRRCREQPAQPFEAAVRLTLEQLQPLRVTTNSPWVEMTVGNNRVTLRAETLAVVQGRLGGLGLLTTPPDGRFSVATREALKRFQQMRRLPTTELPDPDTLLALLGQP
ncbi:MAG TPA: peptidoglycan-binding domain-containing protein [Roseococcus sp.]|nr:peptidoglycan-binding domain-containing protein [Roseococcus sp.]